MLGHEVSHVAEAHGQAIEQNKRVKLGTDMAGGQPRLDRTRSRTPRTTTSSSNGFDRDDENEADQEGIRLANKAGYAPTVSARSSRS